MARSLSLQFALAFVALLATGRGNAVAAEDTSATAGKALLEAHCARCHSIAATGESPLPNAPPLRKVYLQYPIEQLEEGFAEGMGSRHRDMPQIQFSPDQVEAILNYLGSITGVNPRLRPRAPATEETPP